MFKRLYSIKKEVGLTFLLSYFAFTAYSDFRMSSNSFMEKTEVVFEAPDELLPRTVASRKKGDVSIIYFPYSKKNRSEINGTWQVYRFIDSKGNIESLDKVLNLKLIGNSKILLDGDYQQVFRISYKTNKGTLALVKKVRKGYEILELRKFKQKKVKKQNLAKNKNWSKYRHKVAKVEAKVEEGVDGPLDLVIERAFNPSFNKQVLRSDFVEGSMVKVNKNKFQDLSVSLNFGPGKNFIFEIPSLDLKNGGQFAAQLDGQMVTGLVTSSGLEGFRVRIASGKYTGTVMNFVSETQLETILAQEEQRQMQADLHGVENNEYRTEYRERPSQRRNKMRRDEVEREEEYYEDEVYEDEEEYKEDTVKAKIKSKGFNFSAKKATREIASMPIEGLLF